MIRRGFGECVPEKTAPSGSIGPVLVMHLLLLVAAGPAQADQRNAAYWYQRAIERVETISDDDVILLMKYEEDQTAGPSSRVREILSRATPLLNDLRRGAERAYSDFDLDHSQGFGMLLPHLAPLRQIARLVKTDAYVRMHDGDSHGAADRLSTLYRMSEHMGDDRTIISSLIGNAIFAYADGAVQEGFDRAIFNSADAASLLQAVEQIDATDPFGFLEAVAGEQTMVVSWLEERYGDSEDRDEILQYMMPYPDGAKTRNDRSDEGPPGTEELRSMSNDEFAAALEDYDAVMDVAVNAFMQEDPAEGRRILEELATDLEAGKHGPLAGLLMPAFGKVFDTREYAQQAINDRRTMLEGIVAGRSEPVEFANAALFYAQAIEEYGKLRAEDRAQVESLADDPAKEMEAEAQAQLRSVVQPIIDLLREGSSKSRCDFGMLRPNADLALCHAYAAGLHEMFDVLRVDAHFALEQAQRDAVTDRFCITYRAIAHLGQDDPLMSSVVAHHAFQQIERLAEEAAKQIDTSEETRRELARAVEQISFTDPLGYIASLNWTRDLLAQPLKARARRNSGEEQQRQLEEMVEVIAGYDGDRLVYLLAVYDTLAADEKGEQAGDASTGDAISRLSGIVDDDALRQVREEAPFVAPMLAQDRLDFLEGRSVPTFADVAERMRRARSDLRKALIRWQPFNPTPASSSRSPGPSEEPPPPA